jgi:hypothetical protein
MRKFHGHGRVVAAVVAALLVAAMGACGSEDEPETSAERGSQTSQVEGYPVGSNDEEVIRRLIGDFTAKARVGDPGVCELLARQGQAEMTKLAKILNGKKMSCEQAVLTVLAPAKTENSRAKPNKILSISVNGRKAVVLIETPKRLDIPGPDQRSESTVVQVDGEWKVGASRPVEPGAGAY